MCGILGLYSSTGIHPYLTALQAANDIVRYRGPDGAGFALFNIRPSRGERGIWMKSLSDDPKQAEHSNLALAHRRLAIIDLSQAGLQPMASQDRNLWITYNGEVYNYIELRRELESCGHTFLTHTDTEVILHAYQQWGEDCVNRFNGMWAFGIVDLLQNRIFCSRDRFGVKPFHYFHDGKHLVFASEIKQLLAFPFVPQHINDRMVYEYLSFQAVEHSSETFFHSVYNLLPGHNLVFDFMEPHLTTYCYYKPLFAVDESKKLDQAAEEFRFLLKDSVRLRLRSDVKVGSCLSGGLDSSSIVCLIHSLLQEQGVSDIQHTFSSHFDEKEANELTYMETVIRDTGVQAHFTYPKPEGLLDELERLVWHQEEPFGSTSIYAQWSVFKLARENGVTVMLDGQGADELLAGYVPYPTYVYLKELITTKRLLEYALESRRFHIPITQVFFPMVLHELVGILKKSPLLYQAAKKLRPRRDLGPGNKGWLHPDLLRTYEDQSYFKANQQKFVFGEREQLNNYLYQLTFCNNLQALLKYEDRNSMAFSVEGRVPFLDYRLVEFLFSLPSSFKMHNGFSKYVFREGMGGILPERIRWRTTKLGFSTPETLWQRNFLYLLIQDALNDPKIGAYIDSDHAKIYFQEVLHSQQKDFTPWQWANLSLWMKAFNLEPMHS